MRGEREGERVGLKVGFNENVGGKVYGEEVTGTRERRVLGIWDGIRVGRKEGNCEGKNEGL